MTPQPKIDSSVKVLETNYIVYNPDSGGRFSTRTVISPRRIGSSKNIWEIRTLADMEGERWIHSDDWRFFMKSVFSRKDINNEVIMDFLFKRMNFSLPEEIFERL